MQGKWLDIKIPPIIAEPDKHVLARAYFRHGAPTNVQDATSGRMSVIGMAEFVYDPRTSKIYKNRYGSIENLYDDAVALMNLRHHPNEQVRKMFAKVETLAALTEE